MQLHLRGSLDAPDKDTKSLYNRANKDTHHTSYMYPKRFLNKVRASQGGYMFPCSLEKIGVFPLFPKNKLRCSLKFTFIKFPCSQKFCCMFP